MIDLEHLWPDPDRRDAALIALAREMARRGVPSDELTASQQRALQVASFGLQERETADVLGLKVYTVRDVLKSGRRALRAKNTTHACCEALRRGLIN